MEWLLGLVFHGSFWVVEDWEEAEEEMRTSMVALHTQSAERGLNDEISTVCFNKTSKWRTARLANSLHTVAGVTQDKNICAASPGQAGDQTVAFVEGKYQKYGT